MNESKTELFWCLIGNSVQSHFLYNNILTKEKFNEILKKVHKKVYKK